MSGKGSNRRKENKARVNANWPLPDPFERKQAERRAREQQNTKAAGPQNI